MLSKADIPSEYQRKEPVLEARALWSSFEASESVPCPPGLFRPVTCAEIGVIVGNPAPTISVSVKLPGVQPFVLQPAFVTQTFPVASTPIPYGSVAVPPFAGAVQELVVRNVVRAITVQVYGSARSPPDCSPEPAEHRHRHSLPPTGFCRRRSPSPVAAFLSAAPEVVAGTQRINAEAVIRIARVGAHRDVIVAGIDHLAAIIIGGQNLRTRLRCDVA